MVKANTGRGGAPGYLTVEEIEIKEIMDKVCQIFPGPMAAWTSTASLYQTYVEYAKKPVRFIAFGQSLGRIYGRERRYKTHDTDGIARNGWKGILGPGGKILRVQGGRPRKESKDDS